MEKLLPRLREICGDGGVISGTDLDTRAGDWRSQTLCGAGAVVRPRSTDEVSQIMQLCHQHGQPVVAAGGLNLVRLAEGETLRCKLETGARCLLVFSGEFPRAESHAAHLLPPACRLREETNKI